MRYQRIAQISAAREAPPLAYGNLRGPDKAANACTHTGWTDERVDLLKLLWLDGLSASQIAKQLNGVTRNAVIGNLHRMGLTGDGATARLTASGLGATRVSTPTPTRVYNPRPAPALKIAGRGTVFEDAEARPPRAVIPFRDEPAGLRSVMTIERSECRWPIGDPQAASFTLCGCHAPVGPYCDDHKARAFTSKATREWVDRKLAMPARARFT